MNIINKKNPVYIIGGGISGFGSSYFLKKKGYNSLIFEAGDRVGGKAGFFENKDQYFETGGKNFSSNWALLNEILNHYNITEFERQHTSYHIVSNNKIINFTKKIRIPESVPMLRTLGFRGVFELTKLLRYIKKNYNEIYYSSDLLLAIEKKYDKPIDHYFSQKLTKSMLRMISVIMGGAEPKEIHYSYLLSILKIATEKSDYYSLKGGVARLYEEFLKYHPVKLNTRIEKIIIRDNKVKQLILRSNKKKETINTDKVIVTVPLHILKNMVEFPDDVMTAIESIHYNPLTLINAVYEEDVFDDKMTSLMFDESFHLGHCSANRLTAKNSVRFTLSGEKGRQVIGKSDEELIELAEKEFTSVYPIKSKRLFYSVKRHYGGICSYGPNFSSNRKVILEYISTIDGLEIAGDYLEGHNLECCLTSAKKAVERTTPQ